MNVTGAGDVRVGPRQHRNDPRRVLGDHFSPIDAVLAPLYWIYNSPIDLRIAQAVAMVPYFSFGRCSSCPARVAAFVA